MRSDRHEQVAHALFRESNDALFLFNPAVHRVVDVNPAGQRLTGLGRKAILDLAVWELFTGNQPDALAQFTEAYARTGFFQSREGYSLRSASGAAIPVSVSASRIHVTPAPLGLIVARDISERNRAAEALSQIEEMERAKEAAELASRTRSIFLANISHEIRTPMTAVLGLTDLLLTDPDMQALPPERLEDLRTIRQSGHHLLDLINDLLDLTRVDVGKLRIDFRPCSPSELVAEVVASLQGRARAKGLSVKVALATDLPPRIATDPTRLRQILLNLVANAIKFTERGEVRVLVCLEPAADLARSCLVIDVTDTGIGMTEQQIARLYEPFYSSSRQPFSAGLGLALSKRLAELLGGQLSAHGVPGQGSTFTLAIPATRPTTPAEPDDVPSRKSPERPVAPAAPVRLDGLRILLAEDNDASRRVIGLHLQRVGAQILTANDGQEAINLALAHRDGDEAIDLILMDMQMPVLDGYEATRQIRAHGVTTPIVAVTAYATPEDRDECLRIGCDDHLGKPIDWPGLLTLIARISAPRLDGIPASS